MRMVIKIIFVLLWGLGGVLLGIMLKKRLDIKKDYFIDACGFCDNFKHNLTYEQNKLKDFSEKFSYQSADFKENILNFCKNFNSDIPLFKSLSEEEKKEIKKLLSSLGNVDIQTQLALIEERKSALAGFCKKYTEKSEKDGKLYLKLGLLFGLCVGVLLV